MHLKKINKRTKLIPFLFIILAFSMLYLIIYKINLNYSTKEIEKKISARMHKDAKIRYETEYDNEKYFVYTNGTGTDAVGFARFRKNVFGEYNLYQASGTTQYGIFQFVDHALKLPLLYIIYGNNKEIHRIELIMRNTNKVMNKYINEGYYLKIFRFKRNDYIKYVNYYDKDNNLIKSKSL